jgi:hypothetical protein
MYGRNRWLVTIVTITVFSLFLWGFLSIVLWFPRRARYFKGLSRLTPSDQKENLKNRYKSLLDQVRRTIYDQGVRSEVNGILSKATTPSYSNSLRHAAATGLSEIFAAAHEVETQARRELDDLLRLPGGSIGLAGSRGSGKTTLMTLVLRTKSRLATLCALRRLNIQAATFSPRYSFSSAIGLLKTGARKAQLCLLAALTVRNDFHCGSAQISGS